MPDGSCNQAARFSGVLAIMPAPIVERHPKRLRFGPAVFAVPGASSVPGLSSRPLGAIVALVPEIVWQNMQKAAKFGLTEVTPSGVVPYWAAAPVGPVL